MSIDICFLVGWSFFFFFFISVWIIRSYPGGSASNISIFLSLAFVGAANVGNFFYFLFLDIGLLTSKATGSQHSTCHYMTHYMHTAPEVDRHYLPSNHLVYKLTKLCQRIVKWASNLFRSFFWQAFGGLCVLDDDG
jgi:hypothetical protein